MTMQPDQPSRVLRVVLNRNEYKVTWDSEHVLDTIERAKDGKLLSIKNADAKRIFNNEAALFAGRLPEGFSRP